MAEKAIIALTAVVLVVLYLGMRSSLLAPDPTRPPDAPEILGVIRNAGETCDNVYHFKLLGTWDAWTYYLARCQDGGRFVYMQSLTLKKVAAISCDQALKRGYTCPE